MKLYILQAYPDAHKWLADGWVIGYYTNKRALRNAIKAHADELGLYAEKEFYRAFDSGDWYSVNTYAETGSIDRVDVNPCF